MLVVTSHVTLADNVVLAGRSAVTNDVPDAGPYGGYPLQPLKEAMKTAVSIGQLNEIRRNLKRVMRHLHLTDTRSEEIRRLIYVMAALDEEAVHTLWTTRIRFVRGAGGAGGDRGSVRENLGEPG